MNVSDFEVIEKKEPTVPLQGELPVVNLYLSHALFIISNFIINLMFSKFTHVYVIEKMAM